MTKTKKILGKRKKERKMLNNDIKQEDSTMGGECTGNTEAEKLVSSDQSLAGPGSRSVSMSPSQVGSESSSASSSESGSSLSPSPVGEESEDEGSEFYRPGGYHPVHINETYNGRYVVVRKLGWGHYSTVWKVIDTKNPGKLYALKVVKSAKNYTRAAIDEIKILNVITSRDPLNTMCCTHLIDSFTHEGPNGTRKDYHTHTHTHITLKKRHIYTHIHTFFLCVSEYRLLHGV